MTRPTTNAVLLTSNESDSLKEPKSELSPDTVDTTTRLIYADRKITVRKGYAHQIQEIEVEKSALGNMRVDLGSSYTFEVLDEGGLHRYLGWKVKDIREHSVVFAAT